MRHYFKFRKFGNSSSYSKSLFSNLCNSLIKYEFLNISLYKAKELRIFFEPLITISKNFSNFNFRFLFKKINNVESVLKLFKIIGPRYKYRNGGYIRIFKKTCFKKGDFSNICYIIFS